MGRLKRLLRWRREIRAGAFLDSSDVVENLAKWETDAVAHQRLLFAAQKLRAKGRKEYR